VTECRTNLISTQSEAITTKRVQYNENNTIGYVTATNKRTWLWCRP